MSISKTALTVVTLGVVGAIVILSLPPPWPNIVPDITLFTTDGEELALRDLQGHPLLITFWATDCAPCMKEVPHLIKLYDELAPRGLNLVAIAMYYDPPNRVLAMRKRYKIPYTIALDIDADAARAFGNIRLTPTTFLIAPDGHIVYYRSGKLDMEEVRRDVLGMLNSLQTNRRFDTDTRS